MDERKYRINLTLDRNYKIVWLDGEQEVDSDEKSNFEEILSAVAGKSVSEIGDYCALKERRILPKCKLAKWELSDVAALPIIQAELLKDIVLMHNRTVEFYNKIGNKREK